LRKLAQRPRMWQLSSVALRAGKTGSRPKKRKKAPSLAERLEEMEQLMDLVLRASLRGHLLPSERRGIKSYLAAKKPEVVVKPRKTQPRCPVCRSPLTNPDVHRCPWCSVLLDTRDRRGNRKKK
jgi:hypothetical protein